ncbi:MAG TPA: curli-like amyloid fiber formation chaperone CsgH [Moheibacter sp.]|nr:curli-like amyloid fiber formation chaperone CsgH [Moheibacter sp.]
MKIITSIFIILPLILFAQASDENPVEANIEVTQQENIITLQPTLQNHSALFFEYNYLLLVKKTDQNSNLSVNKQSGKFTLEPGEVKKLSTSQINQTESQNIKAVLYIRDENKNTLITKDSIEIKGSVKAKVEESSLFIEGLVVDETKTKFGKDFYDNFFTAYNQYPQKYKFIILISEMPYRGQTSIIQLKIDQEVIYEFYSNPNEEYSKYQVGMALRAIAKYAEDKEKIKQEFIY